MALRILVFSIAWLPIIRLSLFPLESMRPNLLDIIIFSLAVWICFYSVQNMRVEGRSPPCTQFLTALLPMLCTMEMDGNITTMLRGLSSTGSCSVGPQAPLVPLYCTMLDFSISPLQFKSCAVFYVLQMAYRAFVWNLKRQVLSVLSKKAFGLKIQKCQ